MSIDISIHAPRVGSDPGRLRKPPRRPDFNPRSPCGERLGNLIRTASGFLFQSTLPVWGATGLHEAVLDGTVISIHAPRVGSDLPATCDLADAVISIHAPRVGSDATQRNRSPARINFNPRSPCGERLAATLRSTTNCEFQSTLPVWGATRIQNPGCSGITDFNPRSPCGERR